MEAGEPARCPPQRRLKFRQRLGGPLEQEQKLAELLSCREDRAGSHRVLLSAFVQLGRSAKDPDRLVASALGLSQASAICRSIATWVRQS